MLWVGPDGAERREPDDVGKLLAREEGFVWVDIPDPDEASARFLAATFEFSGPDVRATLDRSIVPRVRPEHDHVFSILHSAEPGLPGQVRLLELDQFVGPSYLVTVHGPVTEGVPRETVLRETSQVERTIAEGRFTPSSPLELSHTIVSLITRHMEQLVGTIAGRVAVLEQRVLRGQEGNPEDELEEMLRLRHQLLTIRTMAKASAEAHARVGSVPAGLPADARPYVTALADQFEGVTALCEGERDFMQGVLDLYRDRRAARMNRAMERIALISTFALPLTLIASIYGMNTILNPRTDFVQTGIIVGVMTMLTVLVYRYTKRRGWW